MAIAHRSQAGFEQRLALRRRADIEAVPQTFAGRAYWAIKDPVRLKYFHLNDEEYCVFEALDGTASLAGIREKFERRFAPRRLALAQIQSFLGQLHHEGLILADAPGQSHELLEAATENCAGVRGRPTSRTCSPFASVDSIPSGFSTGWLPVVVGFLYSRPSRSRQHL